MGDSKIKITMKLESIIGLEIHVQLKTKSKMFCGCPNDGENKPPNSTVCPICLGHPGTLPVPNSLAVRWAVMTAMAIHCKINERSKFDRKNYFYPDLPKGYQISQFDQPIGEHGYLDIEVNNEVRRIGITRLHLEEDAAKLMHAKDGKHSLVDFNRSGTPLMEIVTEPDMRSPEEAKIFMQELRLIMRHLGVSDADMEKGNLRCDANISLRELGAVTVEAGDFSCCGTRITSNSPRSENSPASAHTTSGEGEGCGKLYPKTEIKNINSFKFVERALAYEVKRQTELWEKGTPPDAQSTRGWDEKKGVTVEQRVKEDSQDYRYFPEPDIPPLHFTKEWMREVEIDIPELPIAKRQRFCEQYGLSASDARVLTDDLDLADYTEKVVSELKSWLQVHEIAEGTEEEIWENNKKKFGRLVGGWLVSKLGGILVEKDIYIQDVKVTPENFAEFIVLIFQGQLSSRMGQDVLKTMVETGKDPSDIIEEGDFKQMSDSEELESVVVAVVNKFPDQVEEYRAGKEPVLKFFIGSVMKETKGQADPKVAEELLRKYLS